MLLLDNKEIYDLSFDLSFVNLERVPAKLANETNENGVIGDIHVRNGVIN